MSNFVDLTGRKFGRLTVIEQAPNKGRGKTTWLCRCDCGQEVAVLANSLISGNTRSCGCLAIEILKQRSYTHALSIGANGKKTRLYGIWIRMRQRCSDQNSSDFDGYGGRGISVCEEWQNYKNFHDWAMSHGYDEHLTIERKDVDGNYEPSNCKWIPARDQARNTRKNHFITFQGQRKTLAEWCEILGMDSSLLRYRLKVWDVRKALTTPVRRQAKCN
jgi:hypothetical protein